MGGAVSDQVVPMSNKCAKGTYLFRRPKRGCQKTVAVHLLEPLAIKHVRFLLAFQNLRIDQVNFDALFF
jgi:hypothetical protein